MSFMQESAVVGQPSDTALAPRIRQRTCIAHRHRKPDEELLRVVAVATAHGGTVLPDPRRRKPGRGAWLTPTLEALELAEKKRAFSRALKVSGQLDTGPVRAYLEQRAPEPEDTRRTEH